MTSAKFVSLSENDQAQAVWGGIYLSNRLDLKYNILLYAVENFYVEVFYSNKINEIVKFRAFDKTDKLIPYLNAINLPPFIKYI